MDGIFTKNAEKLRREDIPINFNEAKQIAKDGGLSNIRITEASGAAFDLKEIGNAPSSGLMGNIYPFDETQTKAKVVEALPSALSDTANRITEDDSEALEEGGMTIERYNKERLSRLLEARKASKELKEKTLESAKEQLVEQREDAKSQGRRNAAESESRYAYIAERLVAADLPLTETNITRIAEAVTMAGEAQFMTDASFSYLVENNLQPTVSNVYKAVHAGTGAKLKVDDAALSQLKTDIDRVIGEAGLEATAETEAAAKSLIESGIPLTKENLSYRAELGDVKAAFEAGEVSKEMLAEGAVAYLKEGYAPKDMNLSVVIKRERIWLSGSLEAASKMRDLGIEPDIDALTLRLEELNAREREASKSAFAGLDNENELADLFEQTLGARDDIEAAGERLAPATFSLRQSITLGAVSITARELSATGESGARITMATASYEASATEIRTDLGDSINKAFSGIDDILKNLNLDLTDGNRRAVRMLGYSSMELTAENVQEMKYYDAQLETLKNGLKPQVTAEIIKRGINPLETTVQELSKITENISKELGQTPEERYSEYLVKLERRHEISAEQRESYIGIYRMLYNIEKTDGAAVGALVKSGRELTLSNLLTESRTIRKKNVDVSVDESFGGMERPETADLSIDRQVAAAYGVATATDAFRNATPGKLEEAERRLAENGKTLENASLEELADELSGLTEDATDRAYRSGRLQSFRETLQESAAQESFLKTFDVEDSAVMIKAAGELLSGTNDIGRLNRIKHAKDNQRSAETDRLRLEADEIAGPDIRGISELPETEAGLETALTEQRHTAISLMESIYANADLTGREAMELSSLKNLAELKNTLVSRKFYDIPLQDEDGILNVHLTLSHESSVSGRFEVATGGITAQGSVKENSVSVIITATGIAEKEMRKDTSLAESLRAAGFERAEVAVSQGTRNGRLSGSGRAETAKLYTAARETVLYLRKIIKSTGEDA